MLNVMMHKIHRMKYLIPILLFMTGQLEGQNWCNEEYNKIHNLQMDSYSVLKNESIALFRRIRKSKKIAKQALKLAYETIEENDCENYSLLVDRIIEIELQLGNKDNAEKIILTTRSRDDDDIIATAMAFLRGKQ